MTRTRLRRHVLAGAIACVAVAMLGGCGAETGLSPAAERGRQVYLAQCTACHAPDPAQPGALGPPVKGASRDLLEAKLLRGTYPPGYVPKRTTSLMPPQPAVAPDIAALAEYLRDAGRPTGMGAPQGPGAPGGSGALRHRRGPLGSADRLPARAYPRSLGRARRGPSRPPSTS